MGDCRKDTCIRCIFSNNLKLPVEGLHDLYHHVTKQNYRTCFNDEGFCPGKHGYGCSFDTWESVFRQLHDEEGFDTFFACDSDNHKGTDDNDGNGKEIHKGSYPSGIIEENTGEQSDNGQFGTTWHKGCQHSRRPSLSVILNGSRGHNPRNGTACTDDHWDNGFSRKTHFNKKPVHDNGNSGHIPAILKQCQKEKEYHDEWQETNNSDETTDDTIKKQGTKER